MSGRLAAILCLGVACSGPPGRHGGDGVNFDAGVEPPDAAPPDAASGPPDLTLNVGRAEVDLALRQHEFAPDACELDPSENCIGAPGMRRLLHFAVETPNLGDGDMILGQPDPDNPNFSYSECHRHYHFEGYAEYRIVDQKGGQIATGRKQAFCLLDTERYLDDDSVAMSAKYRCDFQGIQRGWADVYQANLPCQFIDVTDVPDGSYNLEIELNADRTLVEKDYDNNIVSIPLELGDEALSSPVEACPAGVDARSSAGTHRECDWTLAGTFACVPGSFANVGCGSSPSCGDTTCTGDPMIRVCDAERADGNCSFPAALKSADGGGGGDCPCALGVVCPESGQLSVYTASKQVGEEFTCDVQVIN
jgi:hypothetical protein